MVDEGVTADQWFHFRGCFIILGNFAIIPSRGGLYVFQCQEEVLIVVTFFTVTFFLVDHLEGKVSIFRGECFVFTIPRHCG